MQGLGKACLPRARLKGGLEGKGRNQQPSVPWPRAKRWCVCRLHPSHLPATLKPNYSRLMSARLGPATRCSQIPSPRGRITPACTIGVGSWGTQAGGSPGPAPSGPQWRLLHPSPVPGDIAPLASGVGQRLWVRALGAPRALRARQACCCRWSLPCTRRQEEHPAVPRSGQRHQG